MNNEQLKDLVWRINAYSKANEGIAVQGLIPMRLMILCDLYSIYPNALVQKDLQSTYNIHTSTSSRTLKRLIEQWFIKRECRDTHRTGLKVHLTDDGLDFVRYVFSGRSD